MIVTVDGIVGVGVTVTVGVRVGVRVEVGDEVDVFVAVAGAVGVQVENSRVVRFQSNGSAIPTHAIRTKRQEQVNRLVAHPRLSLFLCRGEGE